MNRQKTWGWLALGNFLLGGAGAGAYMVAAMLYFLGANMVGGLMAMETAASATLVVLGLVCVFVELGRRSRSLNVILNLRTSWMSREAAAASLFLIFALASIAFQSSLLVSITFLSAIGLAASHGILLKAAKAIPSWNAPGAPPLVWSSSISAGASVVLLVSLLSAPIPVHYFAWTSGLGSAVLLLFAVAYFALARGRQELREALAEESNTTAFWISALVGGVFPLLLSVTAGTPVVSTITALLLLAGSSSLKYVLVLRLSYRIPVMALGSPGYIFPASR